MSKYIKYIVALVLVIVCVFLVWYIFFRENQEIVQYMEKFNETVEVINQQTDNNENESENINDSENETNIDKETPPDNDNPDTVDKPVIDNPQNVDKEPNGKKEDNNETVILTSETEMLNKKGEELLKELSKELEDSLLTIQESTGVVDSDILDKEQEL